MAPVRTRARMLCRKLRRILSILVGTSESVSISYSGLLVDRAVGSVQIDEAQIQGDFPMSSEPVEPARETTGMATVDRAG